MYFIKKDFFNKNDKKEKNDIAIAIVVTIVFSVFVYKLMFKTIKKEKVEDLVVLNEPETKTSQSNKESKDDYVYKDSKAYERKKVVAEDAFTIQSDSTVIISDVPTNFENLNNNSTSLISEVENINDITIETPTISMDKISNTNSRVQTEESSLGLEAEHTNIDTEEGQENIEVQKQEVSTDINIQEESEVFDAEQQVVVSEETKEVSNTIDLKEKVVEIQEEVSPEVEEVKEPIKKAVVETNSDSDSFDCVIVVGAFREVSNKTKIIDKLQLLGYSHTEGVLRRGLNYVGVPVECSNRSGKKKLLRELNKEFGIQSWVKKK